VFCLLVLKSLESVSPFLFFVDNEAALSVANHPKTTPKSKFIDLREFRIRDYQQAGFVRPLGFQLG